jgi:hypothetical protein
VVTAEAERKYPPITELSVATMICVIVGGIYIVSYLPKSVSLALPVGLTVVAAELLLYNVFSLSRIENFHWESFWLVAKWSLAAYVVIAGMLEYIFIYDDTPGDVLAVLSGALVIYAINIPLLFGFSVARYQGLAAGELRGG